MDKATPTHSPATVDSVMALHQTAALALFARTEPLTHHANAVIALRAEVERLAAQAAPPKLWLWKNFVAGRPEYWAFDNPYPINLDSGDPQTLGEPCGYAIFKPSRSGRADFSEDEVMSRIAQAESKVSYNLNPNKANADAFDFLRFAKKNLDMHAARVPFANNGLVTAAVAWIQAAETILAAQSPAQAPVVQAVQAGDAVLRKHVLLMLDGMGEQVNATPSTPGNMALQKGMRMAIGTAIDRVKSLPGADESRTFMGEPVVSPRPVGFVVLNHFGPNKHLFSSFYDTRNSEHEWAPVFADRASSGAAQAAPFAKDSWQHAVDNQLVAFGRTSQEFANPHEALAWLAIVNMELGQSNVGAAQAVRMLTREELNDVALSEQVGWGPGEYVEAVQRKFCAVNAGLTIPADCVIGGV